MYFQLAIIPQNIHAVKKKNVCFKNLMATGTIKTQIRKVSVSLIMKILLSYYLSYYTTSTTIFLSFLIKVLSLTYDITYVFMTLLLL